MDTLRKIRKYITEKELIPKNANVLVGLSGGADSVCLLRSLASLSEVMGFRLYGLHVHHGIRGAEADRDAAFSMQTAGACGVPCTVVHVDAPAYAAERQESLEEAGRNLRYRELEKRRQELELQTGRSTRVAVAHHADDQAETVLHNLFRGSGLRGLAGMEPEAGYIIRPLLCLNREEILAFLSALGQSYVTDSTNGDVNFTRNRIRSKILTEAVEINRQAVEHINHTAGMLGEADAYFRQTAQRFVEEKLRRVQEPGRSGEDRENPGDAHIRYVPEGSEGSKVSEEPGRPEVLGGPEILAGPEVLEEWRLPVTELRRLPGFLRRYILMECIRRIGVPVKDWGSVHFEDLDGLAFRQGGSHLDLPCHMTAELRRQQMIFRINRHIESIRRRKKHG